MFAISKDEEGLFIDGGVTPFNNPSLALFQMATFQSFGICWPTGPDKLTVTSVGTGTYWPLFSYAEEGVGRFAKLAAAKQVKPEHWLGDLPRFVTAPAAGRAGS